MDNCKEVEWCDKKIAEASEAGNFEEWQDYTDLKKVWTEKRID